MLADGHDGVYFPRGYWLDAPPKEKCRVSVVYSPELGALQELRRVCGSTPTYRSTFFTPSARGTLLAAPTIPAIEYEDPIDTREQIVLTELLDRLPPEWKPLLMGILSAESAVTFKPPDPSPRRDSERRERGLAPSAASPSQSAAPRQVPEGSGR